MARPRILGGTARGRPLATPRRGTRPTPSRVREALFDILAFEPRGVFLDLFSGSGALGLEAASRGWHAICVDRSREAVEVARRNARDLGLVADVRLGDAVAAARALRAAVDVCSAAPPYPAELGAIFQDLLDSGCVRPGGSYVFQHPTGAPPALHLRADHAQPETRRYGSNALTLVRVSGSGARTAEPPAAAEASAPDRA